MCLSTALRAHLHETVAAKAHTRAQVVRARQVPVQRRGVELGEHVDLGDARVDAVGHGHVNQPVRAADGHGRLGARLCERVQPRACPPSQDDRCAKRATASALSRFTNRNKEASSRKKLTSASSSPAGVRMQGIPWYMQVCAEYLGASPAIEEDTERTELFSSRGFSMTAFTASRHLQPSSSALVLHREASNQHLATSTTTGAPHILGQVLTCYALLQQAQSWPARQGARCAALALRRIPPWPDHPAGSCLHKWVQAAPQQGTQPCLRLVFG